MDETLREEFERQLLQEVKHTEQLYRTVDTAHRGDAREQYFRALHRFSRYAMDGVLPEKVSKRPA
jgi:hypothetical protein